MRRLLIFIFLFTAFAISSFSQDIGNDSRLREIIKQNGQAIVSISYTGNQNIDILTRNVSIISVKDKKINISLSPLTVEWFILQKYNYLISDSKESKDVITSLNLIQAMQWETYPTYSQYDSIIRAFKTHYPLLCNFDTIGTSINGKLVLALKISDNVTIDEDEPEVFYSSTIHGDETGGFIMMLRLADYLLKNYQTNSRVKNLVDNLEIWINPLANPDGTYGKGNTISSPVRYNSNGFDLNRNFPDPVTPNTVKQKETLDMMKFLRKHRFVLSANFHAGAELVNYPWDRWLYKFHADDSWFYNISRRYADTVHVYSGPEYMNVFDNGVTRGAAWYLVYGGRQDYITSELQGREITIELDDQFITPTAQLTLLWQNNWRSLLGYLENAIYGIHGLVLNASTAAPVAAKIFILNHDTDSSHVYSDTLSGSFVRLLSPGIWNLTFSARGFRDTTIKNVPLYPWQKTDLIINMVPVVKNSYSTPVLYPNPATDILNAVLPSLYSGSVNVRIYNQSGMIMSDYNTKVQLGVPLIIDVKRLAAGAYSVFFHNNSTGLSSCVRFVVIK